MTNVLAVLKKSAQAKRSPAVIEALFNRIERRLPEFAQVFDTDEMRIYVRSETPALYNVYEIAGSGIIFGILFDGRNDSSFPVAHGDMPQSLAKEAIRTRGRSLISDCWGHYVALWSDSGGSDGAGRLYALRSPACTFPLFHATCDGIRLIFTNPPDIGRLGLANWTFDWDYFRFHELYHFFDSGESGFREVAYIVHGQCTVFEDEGVEVLDYWPLEKLCTPLPSLKPADSARLLRERVNDCVQAWASCFDRIALRLSGGLDSSIVASALYLTGHAGKVRCHHFFNNAPENDERRYARAVANKIGCPLEEVPDSTANVRYDLIDQFPLSIKPTDNVISAFRGAMEFPVLERWDSQAVFSGSSGDVVFDHGLINFAVDYLCDRGWSAGVFPVTLNVARRLRHSVWNVIRDAVRTWRTGVEQDVFAKLRQSPAPLMSPETVNSVRNDERLKRFIARLHGRGPGKIMQAMSLTQSSESYVTSPSGQRYLGLDPLWSQPLLEYCLALPIYELIWKGWDRGLARLAYENDLPECILMREAKGGISNFAEETFAANLEIYRRYFQDSELVKNGVLDAEIVRNALTDVKGQGWEARSAFLVTTATEIWVQRWKKLIEAYEPL